MTVARAVVLAEARLGAFRAVAAFGALRFAAHSAKVVSAVAVAGHGVASERVLVLAVALLVAIEAESAGRTGRRAVFIFESGGTGTFSCKERKKDGGPLLLV